MLRKSMILVIAFLAANLTIIQAQTGDEGIKVPGTSLTEKLAWLQRSADSHNIYIVEVNANENIAPHTLYYEGGINITVVLRGDTTNQTIRLRSHGTMFTVRPDVTFILDKNITLQGHNGNTGNMVRVEGGTFIMNTGTVISGNASSTYGGGVFISDSGSFTMNGGTISNNTSSHGGGVHIWDSGAKFIMNGGTISGNAASEHGGGVYVNMGSASFNMSDGIITGNTAKQFGGGVCVYQGTTTMRGGSITGNTAAVSGGGVHMIHGTFTKSGGTITGYNSDQSNGNVVKDDVNNILARKGHAVFVSPNRRKETTAGPDVNLNNNTDGGWDR